MSTYKYEDISSWEDVIWLRVIKDPVWRSGESYNRKANIPKDLVLGSITWVSKDSFSHIGSMHIEQNRYAVNFDPSCFIVTQAPTIIKEYWRFKTKEEFIQDGNWEFRQSLLLGGFPKNWNSEGRMNSFLGKHIESKYWETISKGEDFNLETHSWSFRASDCTKLPLPITVTSPGINSMDYSSFKEKELSYQGLEWHRKHGYLEEELLTTNPCAEIALPESDQSLNYPRKLKKRKTIVVESTTNITV